jgi:hypothetical protein
MGVLVYEQFETAGGRRRYICKVIALWRRAVWGNAVCQGVKADRLGA